MTSIGSIADNSLLEAALVGYIQQRDQVSAKMTEIHKELAQRSAKSLSGQTTPRKKRKMSAAGRKAIGDATRG